LPRGLLCDTDGSNSSKTSGNAMTEFDPATHRMVTQQRWFEDFVLGERFVLPSRTQTSAIFAAFQTASGDTHPVHYDIEYCRARGMPHLLAHGFQTLIHTAPGAGLFPSSNSRADFSNPSMPMTPSIPRSKSSSLRRAAPRA
jgi:hypothetical protein